MTDRMTHWERVRAALAGDEVDRPPISVWRHFYRRENSVEGLAEAMLEFQRRFDWDFMKVNPRASYHSEDWGVGSRFSGSDSETPQFVNWPVSTASDWESVRPLDIGRGVLGQQLEALRLISGALVDEVPFVMTVFTPLSIAAQMVQSRDAMLSYLLEHPAKVHRALEAITETFSEFSAECLSIGAAGLFFATTGWGTYDALTDEQYAEFGCPYDLRILERVKEAEFNVLNVCGSNNMLLALADYPVAAVSWDASDETNVWLKEGEKVTGKAAIGGMPPIPDLSPEDVTREARWTLDTMDGTHWMLGPGCTVSPDMPEATLRALRNAFD